MSFWADLVRILSLTFTSLTFVVLLVMMIQTWFYGRRGYGVQGLHMMWRNLRRLFRRKVVSIYEAQGLVCEIICPFCGELIYEGNTNTDDPDDEVYWEIVGDHCASHPSCEKQRRERRRIRYGY